MLTVMKFGGSSVADLEHIRNVAKRCIEKQQAGSQVVVVLSAMGKTTDNLIATAKQITEQPSEGNWTCCFQQENKYLYR